MSVFRGIEAKRRRRRKSILLDLQDGKCFWCPQQLEYKTATLDELIPRGRGGTQKWTNIVISCAPCNHGRGDMIAPHWAFAKVEAREQQRAEVAA
jgi:5-methylcytosine-specific restriction endonuclease McrA